MTEPNRAQALMDEFKAGLDKDGPLVLAERIAQLEVERDAALTKINDDGAETTRAMAVMESELDTLRDELASANARAAKAEKGEKAAKGEVRKLTTPAKPRKLGAIDGDPLTVEALRDRINDADEVSIAFSDGTREVAGIAPVAVSGDAWTDHANGLMLATKVDIDGPGDTGTSVTIDGYALMIDGKQVAYSRRSTPIQIAPGQRVQIVDDIIF